jgi:hypothetical protein
VTPEQYLFYLEFYRDLFWPNFVEHDGCVFLACTEEYYREWLQKFEGDKMQVEAMMNHRHILDELGPPIENPTRDMVLAIGRLLKETWDAKLRRDFPDRKFVVSFPEDDGELDEYEITFWQERD